jgi:hypothetical protein
VLKCFPFHARVPTMTHTSLPHRLPHRLLFAWGMAEDLTAQVASLTDRVRRVTEDGDAAKQREHVVRKENHTPAGGFSLHAALLCCKWRL